MKQFDLFANPFPRSRERQPFLVTLQSDLLSRSLDTVVVAPLEAAESGKYADRLNPRVNVEEKAFMLIAQEIVTGFAVTGCPARLAAKSQNAQSSALRAAPAGIAFCRPARSRPRVTSAAIASIAAATPATVSP